MPSKITHVSSLFLFCHVHLQAGTITHTRTQSALYLIFIEAGSPLPNTMGHSDPHRVSLKFPHLIPLQVTVL